LEQLPYQHRRAVAAVRELAQLVATKAEVPRAEVVGQVADKPLQDKVAAEVVVLLTEAAVSEAVLPVLVLLAQEQ
jgi:hypothetical protein